MKWVKDIIKSRTFLNMDEADSLHWYHYLGFLTKLSLYILLALLVYFAFFAGNNIPVNQEYVPGECFPYGGAC